MARLVVFLSLLAACGGSSSESPWPVEPLDMEGAPIGEQERDTRAPDTTGIDNYAQGGGSAAEEAPEAPEEEEGVIEETVPEEP